MVAAMKAILLSAAAAFVSCTASNAASVTNADAETRVIVVTERGSRVTLMVPPGAAETFCHRGCFIAWGDGDRAALKGDEDLLIEGGVVRFREGG
jgi:hypothetical protein